MADSQAFWHGDAPPHLGRLSRLGGSQHFRPRHLGLSVPGETPLDSTGKSDNGFVHLSPGLGLPIAGKVRKPAKSGAAATLPATH